MLTCLAAPQLEGLAPKGELLNPSPSCSLRLWALTHHLAPRASAARPAPDTSTPQLGAAAPGTKAALRHFKSLSAAFTEAHPTKSAHPSNHPAVTGRAAGSKGMLNEVLLEYLTFWNVRAPAPSQIPLISRKKKKGGEGEKEELLIVYKKRSFQIKNPTFQVLKKNFWANTSIFLAFLSKALIQAFRAAWAVNLQTYCCSAHQAVFWDKYKHISRWIINSFQLVLIASPPRLCTAPLRTINYCYLITSYSGLNYRKNQVFITKKHQNSSKLLQDILKISRQTWETLKLRTVRKKKKKKITFSRL